MLGIPKQPTIDVPIALDIKPKGDKFLYYKRKLEIVESSMRVFPFWNNIVVWVFITYSFITLYFILFLIDKAFDRFPDTVQLFIFDSNSPSLEKGSLYLLILIPLINFLMTFLFGYKLYNKKKYISYTLFTINLIATSLFLVTLIKIIQMHYAIIQ